MKRSMVLLSAALLMTACPEAPSDNDAGEPDPSPAADAGEPEAPADAGEPEAPADAGEPEAPADAGEPEAPADAGEPEAPADAGEPEAPTDAGDDDAGTNPDDAGTTPDDDAGTTPDTDAGTTPDDDAGTNPDDDAGTPGDDAGSSPDATDVTPNMGAISDFFEDNADAGTPSHLYRIQLGAGEVLHAYTDGEDDCDYDESNPNSFDTEMYMYASDGETQIGYNDDYGNTYCSQVSYGTTDQPETVFVKVQPLNEGEGGHYDVTFVTHPNDTYEPDNDEDAATPLMIPDTITGLRDDGTVDTFVFSGVAGTTYQAAIQDGVCVPGDFSALEMTVTDSVGNALGSDAEGMMGVHSGECASVLIDAVATGDIYIFVGQRSRSLPTGPTYSVTLSEVTPP